MEHGPAPFRGGPPQEAYPSHTQTRRLVRAAGRRGHGPAPLRRGSPQGAYANQKNFGNFAKMSSDMARARVLLAESAADGKAAPDPRWSLDSQAGTEGFSSLRRLQSEESQNDEARLWRILWLTVRQIAIHGPFYFLGNVRV